MHNTTKTKIIQVSSTSPSYFLNTGKGEVQDILRDDWYAQVANEIKKLRKDFEIECWVPEKSNECIKENIFSSVKFKTFPTTLSLRPSFEMSRTLIKQLNEEIKKAEKESKRLIIHLHEYHSWMIYLILFLIKKNKMVKIIAQHHGGRSPLENLKRYKRLFLALPLILLMQICENTLFKKICVFYALSEEEMDYLKKIAKNSVIKFQTMGIGNEFFNRGKDKKRIRIKIGLEKDTKYFLYVGRIKTTKGIKELLDAFKKIKEKNIKLLLLGGGSDIGIFKKYLDINKIENVKFLGSIYGEKRLDYFDACDYLILPSYTEGAPVVLMEAIAKNLPVIATDVGGVDKMIKNGREGIIINPRSSEDIKKAVYEILTWGSKDIRKYAYKYKWEKIIKETIEDYEK